MSAHVVIDNVLPEYEFERLAEQLETGWSFGWKSNPAKDIFSFFHQHFAGNEVPDTNGGDQYECSAELQRVNSLIGFIWDDMIRGFVDPKDRLVRCYANGMPYGCDGTLHRDSVDPTARTIILYANPEWDPNWGGETLLFRNNREDIEFACYPKPNRLLMFQADTPHLARGVSRSCPTLRTTLMFKTQRSPQT